MRKILAIDDQFDNLITIKAVLKMLLPEYEVITAQTGKQGIQLAKEKQPDVILLDIILPEMDGYQVCRLLKADEHTSSIPIVMITALRIDANSKVKALDLGADALVSKPFEPVELIAQLKVVLRTKLAEDKLRDEKEELNRLVRERTKVLEESELKYRLLVESIQEPILVVQNGIVKFVNPEAMALSEYIIDEVLGKSFMNFIYEEDKDTAFEKFQKRASGQTVAGEPFIRVVSKSGKVLSFNYKVNELMWQNEHSYLYILNNITEKIEVEKHKVLQAQRNEALLELHKSASVVNNKDLYELAINKTVAITNSKFGFFYEVNTEQNTIQLIAWKLEAPIKAEASFIRTTTTIDSLGAWGDCIREKKAHVYNDVSTMAVPKELPHGGVDFKRYMSVPVTLNDFVYYIFCIGNKEHEYTNLDLDNIQIIANEISKLIEKRNYQQSIKESTEKYISIHTNAPLPLQSLNSKGEIVEVNPAWLKTMGYAKEDVLGRWYGEFLHEDFVSDFVENFPTLISKGRVRSVPLRLRTKNGEFIDIKLDGSASYGANGDFKQTYCTFKNVTKEVRQQRLLEESEAKYRSFAEHFNGIAFRAFSDSSVDFMNGKVKEITGLDEADFISGNILMKDLVHPDDKMKAAVSIASFMASDRQTNSLNYRIVTKNQEIRWVNISITKFEEKGNTGVYGILQDITQIQETNVLLEESNRFNKTLLDTIPFPIEIVNQRGEILFLNPEMQSLAGDAKVGDTCWNLYRDDKKQYKNCPLRKRIQIGEISKVETEEAFGGRKFDIIHKGMWFNGVKALMEIFVETTERKKYEADLIAAKEKANESDRLKTAFLANMSHEIRTPMNGIMGFTSLLQEPDLTGEDKSRYISIIQKSGERMLNTVNDIIEISKIETGQINISEKKVNVSRHLSNLVQFFELEAKNKGLQISLENRIKDDDAEIIIDKNKFGSIISNLLKNAIKFTDKGFLKIGAQKKDDFLEFYVQDSGIGIPENRLDAIFNRFEQADIDDSRVFEGSGLGLAITKSYVEMLGGEIKVDSALNQGSVFCFTIPYKSANSKPVESGSNALGINNGMPNKHLSILVAEDDEISRLHLSILLKRISTNVSFATNGAEAIEKCRQNKEINLVFMDMKMPVMDGYLATRKIREFNESVIIIAQTAFVLPGDKEKVLNAGCNDYLTKPINKDKLQSLIRKYF